MQKAALMLFCITLVTSCATRPAQPPVTANVIQVTDPAFNTHPLLFGWELAGDPLLKLSDDLSLAVLGLQLSESESRLFYSLQGMQAAQFFEKYSLQIIDNNGQVAALVEVFPLSRFEDLELGVMNFEPRFMYGTELYLQLLDPKAESENQKRLICKFDGPSQEAYLKGRLVFMLREAGVEQAGHRPEITIWHPTGEKYLPETPVQTETKGTPSGPLPTSTAIAYSPWVDSPPDILVQYELSFIVKDEKDEQVFSIDIQMLTNGDVNGKQSGALIIPERILLATPVPVSYPYP